MSFDTKIYLKTLTSLPGVYCMQDVQGQVIYVGKAKNLKKRVSILHQAKLIHRKRK